jgi:hypothetical protein
LGYDLEHYLTEKKYLVGKGDSHMGLAIAYKRSKYKLVGEPYLVDYSEMQNIYKNGAGKPDK